MVNTPPIKTINFKQLVLEADPNWEKENLRPVIYEFSNGRKFVKDPQVYTD